jgi:hypothetical protein
VSAPRGQQATPEAFWAIQEGAGAGPGGWWLATEIEPLCLDDCVYFTPDAQEQATRIDLNWRAQRPGPALPMAAWEEPGGCATQVAGSNLEGGRSLTAQAQKAAGVP